MVPIPIQQSLFIDGFRANVMPDQFPTAAMHFNSMAIGVGSLLISTVVRQG